MWHVSVSLQHPTRGPLDAPRTVEAAAVKALRSVGGDHEWWTVSPAGVGHLRVPTTDTEADATPPYRGPIDDAGDSGPERPRTP